MATIILYAIGIAGWIFTLRGRTALMPGAFALAVVVLITWSGVQWLRLSSQTDRA
jgi:hypothetical protein